MSIFGIQIGILQKATVLQVIATQFWGTAVLRYLLCKKNEPELSLHFLVTSYDEQVHVYKRKIICGADLEKTYI